MSEAPTTLQTADIMEILELLPHRYPFLLVDRIIEIDGDNSCIGIKNVTFNDIFFQGHYPGTPIMPGVLLIENMAQTCGWLPLAAPFPSHCWQIACFGTWISFSHPFAASRNSTKSST